jgi:hypothetical protein
MNSLATHPSSFILKRLTALHVHIFGSVHMMETKILLLDPPFHNIIVRPNFVCLRYNASDLLFFKAFRYMFHKNLPDVHHNKHIVKFVGLYLRSNESYRARNTTIRIRVSQSVYILNFVRLRHKQHIFGNARTFVTRRNPPANFGAYNLRDLFIPRS